jgi:hypothetical protein
MAVKLKTDQSARLYHTQQVHYLTARFNGFDIPRNATAPATVRLGTLPANAMPLETYVRINTAFTSGEVIVGTSAAGSSALVVSTLDVINGTTGTYVVDRYMGTYSTVDVQLYIQTKATGQSNGQADVWLAYLPAVTTVP